MPTDRPIDLDLVAQRILKLAEVATLEHLLALQQSQAEGLLERRDVESETA